MNAPRLLPRRDYEAIKDATADLCRAAHGVNRAAAMTRVKPSRLSEYAAHHERTFIPADVIADLEAEAGAPIVTRVLADLAGFVLVPKGAIANPTAAIADAAPPAMQALGETLMEVGKALSDGVCTPAEARGIRTKSKRAVAQVVELDQAVAARAAKGAAA